MKRCIHCDCHKIFLRFAVAKNANEREWQLPRLEESKMKFNHSSLNSSCKEEIL